MSLGHLSLSTHPHTSSLPQVDLDHIHWKFVLSLRPLFLKHGRMIERNYLEYRPHLLRNNVIGQLEGCCLSHLYPIDTLLVHRPCSTCRLITFLLFPTNVLKHYVDNLPMVHHSHRIGHRAYEQSSPGKERPHTYQGLESRRSPHR